MGELEAVYRQIGRLYALNYAAIGSGLGKLKPKKCKKGWECGYSCQGKDKKNCKSGLTGQAKTYAEWLSRQGPRSATKPDGERNEFAESWRHAWVKAPDNLKELLRITDDPKELKIDPKMGALHRNGSISMADWDTASAEGQMVWRHESGHYLDSKLSGLPSRGNSAMPDYKRQYFSTGATYNNARAKDNQVVNEILKSARQDVKGIGKDALSGYEENEGERILAKKTDRLMSGLYDTAASKVFARGAGSDHEIESEVDNLLTERINAIPKGTLAKQLFERIQGGNLSPGQMRSLKMEVAADSEYPAVIAKLADFAFNRGELNAQDLVNATTKNKVGVGHSNQYYQDRGVFGQNAEAFANIVALHGTGDPLAVEVLKRLAPNQFSVYEKALAEAIQ